MEDFETIKSNIRSYIINEKKIQLPEKVIEINLKDIGGLSNTNYLATITNSTTNEMIDQILYRKFGEISDVVDRDLETMIINDLSLKGLGPKIYEKDKNGKYRIDEYLSNTSPIQKKDEFAPIVINQINQIVNNYSLIINMYKYHISGENINFSIIKDAISKPKRRINNNMFDKCMVEMYNKAILSFNIFSEQFKANINRENNKILYEQFESLEKYMINYKKLFTSIFPKSGFMILCHNDIHRLNLIVRKSDNKLFVLDHEYACLNLVGNDFANYMNESGDLSKLGGRQHREIAHRMYERYPSLLDQPLKVDARSSTAGRCMISMFNFCQELQGLNTELQIHMDASKRDMPFVVGDDDIKLPKAPAAEEYQEQQNKLRQKALRPARLMKTLFTEVPSNGEDMMEAIYEITQDLQNVPELGINLYDLFTKDELFDAWNATNAFWMRYVGMAPGATPRYLRQVPVRDSIVSIADRVIRSGEPALTLRFSHDSSVVPLAYLMGLKETQGCGTDLANAYKKVSIDKLVPMAANIQLVFYRKEGSDDILVKFFLNENETTIPVKSDVSPYYHWSDVKRYWETK